MTTPAAILSATSAIIERRAYELPNISDIAREAGVTRPTVYAYFDNGFAVFAALVASVRDRALAHQEQADTSSAAATFRSTLVPRMDLQIDHHGLLTLLAEQARLRPEMRDLWHELHDRPLRRHARFLDALAARGEARPMASGKIIAEAVEGISLRFASLVAETPSLHDELADALVDLHAQMVRQGM